MKIYIGIYIFLIGPTLSLCAKLPATFKKCDRKDKDFLKCTPEAVQYAMRQLSKPFKEVGLPSLDPLEVPSLMVAAGTTAVGLAQNFTNVKIYGINNVSCTRMDIDFEKKTIDNLCEYPELRLVSDYNINGKILLLDIYGSGEGVVSLEKVKIPVHYNYEEYSKNGKKHIRITELDLKLQPERVRFRFQNLFGGDKLLSENVHQVVNDNWKEVYEDVRSSYDDAFGQILLQIFNNLLSRVPISEIFGEE